MGASRASWSVLVPGALNIFLILLFLHLLHYFPHLTAHFQKAEK